MPRTIADGLQTHDARRADLGSRERLVDEIVTVTDEQIVDAMRFVFERLKLVIEPSGAVGLAASAKDSSQAPSIGIVISGGNVDAQRFSDLIRSATSARS